MTDVYQIAGDIGSPYSMKMRALLRYRRLPFIWCQINPKLREEITHVKPPVIPVIKFPDDGIWHVDSTPMAYELEAKHAGQRSIIPDDAGLSFLSHLIEDMADEWMTKMMYHYRWWREPDQKFCSYWLAVSHTGFAPEEATLAVAEFVRERQVSRLALVGSTETTKPIIEESFLEVVDIFDHHLRENRFLFGSRPSLADFGVFGQFSQLNHDPTSQGIIREKSPRFSSWIDQLDDASGLEEGEWIDPTQSLPLSVIRLLKMAGDVYLPFLIANAEALNKGEETFSVTLMNRMYQQGTFKYQLKCLNWLREEYSQLQGAPKERVDLVLSETGCLPFFSQKPEHSA
ncbi:glutathione S-transferase C-terminal domain-containing protein [bacterium]|nr:glutathione S-transferase C-terminal domain-containing protein [bacterium]